MFLDEMKHEAIPERVFALCEFVKNKPVTEAEAKEYFEPKEVAIKYNVKSSYFPMVRDAASQSQLGLVNVTDRKIALAVDKSVVASMENMRKYIIKHIDVISNSLFYATSQAYFELNEKAYDYLSVSEQGLMDILYQMTGKKLDVDDMRAWRFWAAYLGFGHLARATMSNQTQMNFLPNLYRYLQAAIEISGLEKNKEYRIDDFIDAIRPVCKIAMRDAVNTRHLNMAMSYGLRMLHDTGDIEMRYQLDSKNLWYLYPAELHKLRAEISHVTVRR
jgi:hypothetical protein